MLYEFLTSSSLSTIYRDMLPLEIIRSKFYYVLSTYHNAMLFINTEFYKILTSIRLGNIAGASVCSNVKEEIKSSKWGADTVAFTCQAA